jgi:hypothetical protein
VPLQFTNWRSGYQWIMGKLGGLDANGNIMATPYTEAEVVAMARKEITGADRETLRAALAAMGWTDDRA